MIRLTLLNGKHWYVNPDHIVGIKSGHKYGAAIESDHQTGIEHTIDVTQVQESPEEVARKVLKWRLAMERYRVALSLENPNLWEAEEKKLKALAGLERKDEVIEEQKRQLFYKSQEITELREKSWQDQQWFKQASANITEMQKELDRIEREHAEERAAHNAHVTELCELEQERNMYKASSEVFYERLKKVDEERDKLIEALRWYADEENQKLDESTRHWENVYSPYEMDGGQRARDILKEIGVDLND